MKQLRGGSSLTDTVIAGGYCIGCGACTAVEGSQMRIEMDARGCYEATAESGADEFISLPVVSVCPFSEQARSEDEIGQSLFGDKATHDPYLGYFRAAYAGYAQEGNFRKRGSSGGFGKWILYELLRKDLVDAVIQVAEQEPKGEDKIVYRFAVMDTPEEVLEGSQSVYYPVEMSQALAYIRKHPGRYAITGIPCFVKAIRLLAEQEPVFKERIRFCVGIICGHLKSKYYADMIAWQLGVEPGRLAAIDFRKKLPGTTAKQKGVEVRSRCQNDEVKGPDIVQNLFGTDYNHGFFQYKACDFCDDVVAETADISVGDAWLPQYIPDGRGTSLVIVRHPVLHELVETARSEQRVHLEEITVEQAVASQAGGFRQRREGLAYRLYLADEAGAWRPPKRVQASKRHITRRRKAIYRTRMHMAKHSHEAFQQAVVQRDFSVFRREMEVWLQTYADLYRPTFWMRIKKGLHRRWVHWFSGSRKRWL